MKKLTVLALGFGLLTGMAVFAEDPKPATDTTKTDTTKKKNKKAPKTPPADASKTAPATK